MTRPSGNWLRWKQSEYLFSLPYLYFSYIPVLHVDSAIRHRHGSDKLWGKPTGVVGIFHSLFGGCVWFAVRHAGWLLSWTKCLVPRKFQRCQDLWVLSQRNPRRTWSTYLCGGGGGCVPDNSWGHPRRPDWVLANHLSLLANIITNITDLQLI